MRGKFILMLVSELNKKCRQIKDAINTFGHNPSKLFQLLLNTAQFEFLLKEVSPTDRFFIILHNSKLVSSVEFPTFHLTYQRRMM